MAIMVCLAVVICSKDSCSSMMVFGDALVALIGCKARPDFMLSRLKALSAAVGVALLASLQPSVVKYQSSTYSKSSIFPTAYSLG